MKKLNLPLKSGRQARIIKVENGLNNKDIKQLMNMGLIKGSIIEIINSDLPNLLLLKRENSTFGISKKLADNIVFQPI